MRKRLGPNNWPTEGGLSFPGSFLLPWLLGSVLFHNVEPLTPPAPPPPLRASNCVVDMPRVGELS